MLSIRRSEAGLLLIPRVREAVGGQLEHEWSDGGRALLALSQPSGNSLGSTC